MVAVAWGIAAPGAAVAGQPPTPSEEELRRKAAVVDDEPTCEAEVRALETERDGFTASRKKAALLVATNTLYGAAEAAHAYWVEQRALWLAATTAQARGFIAADLATVKLAPRRVVGPELCRALAKRDAVAAGAVETALPAPLRQAWAYALAAAGDPARCGAAGTLAGLCRNLVSGDWSQCPPHEPSATICTEVPQVIGLDVKTCSLDYDDLGQVEECGMIVGLATPSQGLAACAKLELRPKARAARALQICRAIVQGTPDQCPSPLALEAPAEYDPTATSFIRATLVRRSHGLVVSLLSGSGRGAYCHVRLDVRAREGGKVLARIDEVLRVPRDRPPGLDSDTELSLPQTIDPFTSRLEVAYHCVRRLTW